MKQKSIAASEDAYDLVMDKKQAMEQAGKQSVSMGQALDELLEGKRKNDKKAENKKVVT